MSGILAAASLLGSGCGSGKTFANRPRPATPVDLSVYVDDARISVSPASLGAGPVVLIVTNQAKRSEALRLQSADGASGSLADTGPITPQAAASVKVDLRPGDYTVATETGGNDASQATGSPIQAAHLHIGPPRPSTTNTLLQP